MTKVSIQKIRRFLNRKFSQEPFEEEINMTWGEKHWKAFQFSYILAGQPTPDFNLLFAWECNKGGEKKYSNEGEGGTKMPHGIHFWLHACDIEIRCETPEAVHWRNHNLKKRQLIQNSFKKSRSFSLGWGRHIKVNVPCKYWFEINWYFCRKSPPPHLQARVTNIYHREVGRLYGRLPYCVPYLLSITRLPQDKTSRP